MGLSARINRLEKQRPAAPPEKNPDHDYWTAFRDFAFAVLAENGHADALVAVQERVSRSESWINWSSHAALWLASQVLWDALKSFPAANTLLEGAVDKLDREIQENRDALNNVPAATKLLQDAANEMADGTAACRHAGS